MCYIKEIVFHTEDLEIHWIILNLEWCDQFCIYKYKEWQKCYIRDEVTILVLKGLCIEKDEQVKSS